VDEDTDGPVPRPPPHASPESLYAWRARNYFRLPASAKRAMLRDYESTGFGYADYRGSAGYGQSVARQSWVLERVERLPTVRLVTYVEEGWSVQDVFAFTHRI
jgi:hypothetical protein